MNRFGNTGIKKAIAAIFFAALAFVYAEKVVHKHECSVIETNQTSVSHNFDYTSCTLCDFQPVTASEVPFIEECVIPLKFVFNSFAPNSDNYYYEPFLAIHGRGPPVAG